MIEIYLFVNPLGDSCLHLEKEIIALAKTKKKKIQFRFIPLLNIKTIDYIMRLKNIAIHNIEERNKLFDTSYSAALDHKAAQQQGKKKGQTLLLALQQAVAVDKIPYSKQLVEELAVRSGCDLEMFQEDRASSVVKELFQTDQHIAYEMGVTMHPSVVIYNYSLNPDFGILIDNYDSMTKISELCQTSEENRTIFQQSLNQSKYHDPRISKGHLHLL